MACTVYGSSPVAHNDTNSDWIINSWKTVMDGSVDRFALYHESSNLANEFIAYQMTGNQIEHYANIARVVTKSLANFIQNNEKFFDGGDKEISQRIYGEYNRLSNK